MEVHRIPQGQYVDALRWLPWPSTLALSLWDADTGLSTLEIASLQVPDLADHSPWMETQASWALNTRTTAMKTSSNQANIALALASETGSLSVFLIDAMHPSLDSPPLVLEHLHNDVPSALDIQRDSLQCVTVGGDGKINLVHGMEQESNGGITDDLVELLPNLLQNGKKLQQEESATVDASEMRKLVNILEETDGKQQGGCRWSRQHPCRRCPPFPQASLCGWWIGGTVLAWDLRLQSELYTLAGTKGGKGHSVPGPAMIAEGEIWNVKLDPALQGGDQGTESGKIPPVLMCSEDGILAVIEAGLATELAVESCAINSFDVDSDLGNEIVCALEHESVLYIKRPT